MYSERGLFVSGKVATSVENATSSQGPELVLVGENAYKSNIDTNTVFTLATQAITVNQGPVTVQKHFMCTILTTTG